MSKKIQFYIFIIVIMIIGAFSMKMFNKNVLKIEVISDEDTAEKVADAILSSVYGEDNIQKQKPFIVNYNKISKVWHIKGRYPNNSSEKITVGGEAEIKIRKSDGKVMYIHHGK